MALLDRYVPIKYGIKTDDQIGGCHHSHINISFSGVEMFFSSTESAENMSNKLGFRVFSLLCFDVVH